MIVINNKFIPFKGYETINLFGILFTKGYIDKFEYNHENIHTQQLIECFIAGAIIIFAICAIFDYSLLWMLISPATFYILYCLEYVAIRLFHKKQSNAYKDVSFEEEAWLNQNNLDYVKSRIPFNWIRFVKPKSN